MRPVPPAQSQPTGRLSLIGVLAIALFFELWLNRVAIQLLRIDPGHPLAATLHKLNWVALFCYEFAAVFAVALFVAALGRLIFSRRDRGPLRMSLALVGGVTAALCAFGIFRHLPLRFVAHLMMSTLFLMLVIVLGVLAQPTSRRLRVGIAALMVPIALMLGARLMQIFSGPSVLDPRATQLADIAGGLFVLVGLLSPWLFPTDDPDDRAGPVALVLGLLVAVGGLVLGKLDWDFTTRIASMGFGVTIPVSSIALPFYVMGAAAYAYTIGALILRPGSDRLRGIGLCIVCFVGLHGGLQNELPYQLAASLVGLLCLFESAARPPAGAISREELDELLRRWAQLLGATQVTVVGSPGREHARMSYSVENVPATLHVDRRAAVISTIELSVGEIPPRTPPLSIIARGGAALGPSAPGSAVATGEPAFDARFVVRDHRGAGTALLDAETRARILRLARGWIGVWPQRGARYRGRALPTGDDGPPSLTQLLADLRERSGS